MQKFACAAFATLASAQYSPPSLIESKAVHYAEEQENKDYSVIINQMTGQDKFILLPQDTAAVPNPVCTACTEVFNIGGIWNVASIDLKTVTFQCKLAGAVAYNAVYDCTGAGNDYGHCPKPNGTIGEEWKADFGFDVPGFAPPFQYDVTVEAKDSKGASIFLIETKFYIP